MTNLEYALKYAQLGWRVFPTHFIRPDGSCSCGNQNCKSAGKHPIYELTIRGQDDATTNPEAIKSWWRKVPDANIAVHLAPSNLVAIDIDPRNGGLETIEALENEHGKIESDVLQLTGGGGEHRVFYLSADNHLQLPGKLGPGVDVKRNGYIIVEPSNHKSGGTYAWEGMSDPLEGIIPSPLPDWIRDKGHTAQSNAVYDNVFTPIPENLKQDILEALNYYPAKTRDDWLHLGFALHQLNAGQEGFKIFDEWSARSEHYNPAGLMKAWRSFKNKGLNGITYRTIFAKAQENGWVNGAKYVEPPAVVPPTVIKKVHRKLDYFYKIPCPRLQEVSEWFNGLAEEYHPMISTLGALAFGSIITARKYRSTNKNWTSMMFVLSGASGIGKNYIQVGIERLLLHAGLSRRISGDFYTHQAAIYTALKQAPAHICISDEFGENFFEARKNNNSNKMTVFKALKKVYSGCDHLFKAETYASNRSEDERKPIINPALTLLGLTTPLQFFSEIKTQHIEGGLMNRFVVLSVTRDGLKKPTIKSDVPPESVVEFFKRVAHNTIEVGFDMSPTPIAVEFSEPAKVLFDDFLKEQSAYADRLGEESGLSVMPNRWRENAMRIATMLAAINNPEKPIITEQEAIWSIEFVRYCGQELIANLNSQAAENDYQANLNKVYQFIEEAGERGRTGTELSRRFRNIKSREMNEIKAHLIESGSILFLDKGTSGRPASIYIPRSGKEVDWEKS